MKKTMVLVYAQNLRQGDIIEGPDGRSTVVSIYPQFDALHIDFAEGDGNRCWSGVGGLEKITVYERRLPTNPPCGFVVGHHGKILFSEVAVVTDKDEDVFQLTMVDARKVDVPKRAVAHIIGDFLFKPN